MSEDLVLNDRYRLAERLATGGMGEVWRATDEILARPVAVKLLRSDRLGDETARSRFRAEARYAAGLQNRGIAQVYDFGEQDDLVYLVMELVPGEPLSAVLHRTGRLSAETTLDIVAQTARALHTAHLAGIVHRDVKPGNLMVTPDGTVKVTDFGIARAIGAGAGPSVTGGGMVMGTAQYISPEQASGRELTPAADLYSLGIVAYECLAGAVPFDGDTPVAIALRQVRDEPPELDGQVPAEVRKLVARMLAKDPEDRPASALTLADRASVVRESLLLAAGSGPRTAAGPDPRTAPTRDDTVVSPPPPPPPVVPLPDLGDFGEDDPGHRSALFFTSMAVGILLLGAILVGSMWRMPHKSGNLNGSTAVQPDRSVPTSRVRVPGGNAFTPPVSVPTGSSAAPSGPVSTSPLPKTSTSGRPNPSSTPKAPPPSHTPRPTTTPSTSTTPTPSPTPSPSTSSPGGLGSDSKV
jgi:serine/threonine-protein kinase